jgi:uncharacterized membrane protein
MKSQMIFGSLLTILGIAGMIYGAFLFLGENSSDWKPIVVFIFLGLIFFSSGLGLIKNSDDRR